MTRTARKSKLSLLKRGRILVGYKDGRVRFKFVSEPAKEVKIAKKPARKWILSGFFSDDLLEDC